MIIELPKSIKMTYVQIRKGRLYLYNNLRFEDLMYELTYKLKKDRCIYCGKKLNRECSTLDHKYPRATGGISITNNLFPCCQKCNTEKGFLLHEEYLKYRKIKDKKDKEKYTIQCEKYKEHVLVKKGFILPREWVDFIFLDEIKYEKSPTECKGRKYQKILRFYQKYHKMPRPVVVDKNLKLLDGYNLILFAKENNIKKIPVIILENVILQKRN